MKKDISLNAIKNIVEKVTGINISDNCREDDIAVARFIYMYFGYLMTNQPQRVIAAKVNRNHASVVHARKTLFTKIKENERYLKWYDKINEHINDYSKKKIEQYDAFDFIKEIKEKDKIIESLKDQLIKNTVDRTPVFNTKFKELNHLLLELDSRDFEGVINRLKPFILMQKRERERNKQFLRTA